MLKSLLTEDFSLLLNFHRFGSEIVFTFFDFI